jgi:hypothetical protein
MYKNKATSERSPGWINDGIIGAVGSLYVLARLAQ